MDHIQHYPSPIGDMILASDGITLTGLWFEGQKHFGTTLTGAYVLSDLPVFRETMRWLDRYFQGDEPGVLPPIALKGTPFQLRVWQVLTTIPYGQTVTYGEIAKELSASSAQAVGGAVGRNPISILVPCHRVVGSKGTLIGYAGGLDKKEFLLALEQSKTALA